MPLPLRLVVILGAPMLCLVGLVGAFADGANLFERVLLAGLNPLAGVAAAWSVVDDDAPERRWVTVLAAAALVGNVVAAIAIAVGWSTGDFELPLIFAVPFLAYLALGLVRRSSAHN